MRLDRLLGIILILLKRRKVTAAELASHFEVSVRTIYRDIDAIAASGVPIVSYQGAGGGVGVAENYKLDRQVLKPEELLSILAALRGVGRVFGDRRLLRAEEKIEALLSQGEVGRLTDEVHIDLLPWGNGYGGQDAERLQLIREAIGARSLLSIAYRGMANPEGQRQVEPMTLVLRGSVWYLYGYCRLRDDYRLFRVSRIRDLRPLQETFARRARSYEEYARETARQPPTALVDLVLRFTPRVRRAVEDYFAAEQIAVDADGSVIVRVTWPEDEWVYGFILGHGPEVEVLEPRRLRALIRDRAAAGARQYATD